jgi:hypothetical protein
MYAPAIKRTTMPANRSRRRGPGSDLYSLPKSFVRKNCKSLSLPGDGRSRGGGANEGRVEEGRSKEDRPRNERVSGSSNGSSEGFVNCARGGKTISRERSGEPQNPQNLCCGRFSRSQAEQKTLSAVRGVAAAWAAEDCGRSPGDVSLSNSRKRSNTARSRASGGWVKYTCAHLPRFRSSRGFRSGFNSGFGSSSGSCNLGHEFCKVRSPRRLGCGNSTPAGGELSNLRGLFEVFLRCHEVLVP